MLSLLSSSLSLLSSLLPATLGTSHHVPSSKSLPTVFLFVDKLIPTVFLFVDKLTVVIVIVIVVVVVVIVVVVG